MHKMVQITLNQFMDVIFSLFQFKPLCLNYERCYETAPSTVTVQMSPEDVTDVLGLTQVAMEKKEKAITARAASCDPPKLSEV